MQLDLLDRGLGHTTLPGLVLLYALPPLLLATEHVMILVLLATEGREALETTFFWQRLWRHMVQSWYRWLTGFYAAPSF